MKSMKPGDRCIWKGEPRRAPQGLVHIVQHALGPTWAFCNDTSFYFVKTDALPTCIECIVKRGQSRYG